MRCPTCGGEFGPMGPLPNPQDYARQMAQLQNSWYQQNQMSQGYGMQNAWNPYQGGGIADSIDHSKDEEPPVPPEPKPLTTWQQFKIEIRKIFP